MLENVDVGFRLVVDVGLLGSLVQDDTLHLEAGFILMAQHV